MKLYAGIDLHSNNNYLGILDEEDKEVYKNRLPNDLRVVLREMEPYRETIQGIAVESTFNWYWLVDGLMDHGYPVHLANPAAIKQYEGLKHINDWYETFQLARLLRLGILPEGYIYPQKTRHIRDLLRKRLLLVRQRTTHILSFQTLACRSLGLNIKANDIKRLDLEELEKLLRDEYLALSGRANIMVLRFLDERIKEIEKEVLKVAKLKDEFKNLLTVAGLGKILALTVMYETGDIGRFEKVGDYASYSRNVKSQRITNGRLKGEGNRKCGNKYLSWAFVEAAHHAIANYQYVRRYYQRKMAKTNKIVARKAVSHKLARASYFIMKKGVAFDPKKAFSKKVGCGS